MKGKIILFIFTLFFLFCSGQIFGWFKPEQAPADLSSVVEKVSQPEYVPQRVVFVGDMMFDRGVEAKMAQKASFTYPVELISSFLCRFDFAIGNLEGPINEKPKYFSDESMTFSFDKRVVESLKAGKFGLVSLANNHTLNMGDDGLEETRQILKDDNINFAGDPIGCDADYIYQKDGVTYYAINVTLPNDCQDGEIVDWVKEIRFYNPETFFVVMMHWGTEYKAVNSEEQADLAHAMIDAGADLIIGGHPHVIQNIEEYKGKLIFYSLGNFIFDQYFSKETQEGLGVGMEIYPEKKVFNLYAIKNKASQPELMGDDEKKALLEGLAGRSSESLVDSIKNGSIEIKD